MTDDPRYHHLLELGWRRKLSPAEESELRALLQAHPQGQADLEAEAGLTEALGRLADAPVASNFTARVMQAVEREAAAAERNRNREPEWLRWLGPLRWLPRAAFAVLVIGAGMLSYHEARDARRKSIVTGVEMVSEVSSLPGPEILQDFDAIRALNRTPPADVELLSLLQ